MSNPAKGISPSKGLYIKLGRSGIWEKECLENGILRFGYKETPFDAAVSGDWETVRKVWLDARKDEGTATRDVIQIRHFFEATADTLAMDCVFRGFSLVVLCQAGRYKTLRTGKEATGRRSTAGTTLTLTA